MDEHGMYQRLDHNMNSGKGIRGKSKIEGELSSLQKRILELQRQRRLAYRSSVKVKKTIHNQINQIVKCLRARERYLLSKVDEAYMSEDTNYDTQLSVLQSREIRCRELYSNLDNFKEKIDAMKKINNILEEVNHFEKRTFKPLQFISSFEAVKETANFYGCLEGEFIEMDFPSECCNVSPNSDNQFCPIFIIDKDLHIDNDYGDTKNKPKQRERTESVDSFEIIDLLGNMNCDDPVKNAHETETDSSTSANSSPKYEELYRVADSSKDSGVLIQTPSLHSDEKKLKEDTKEKMQDISFKGQPSKHCFLGSYEEGIKQLTQQTLKDSQRKNNGIYHRYSVTTDTKSWLRNTKIPSPNIPAMNTDRNNSKVNNKCSQVDSVKHAFASFLIKDRPENWLSK